ncbi:MAG: carboxypeptidase regulatory-like domain-containing protein, partial [Acidobacteria bacterium]|nr:carboxypeptidase regulatory-like domain-containing protein [Acidobacteriota bacterium]
PTEMELTDEQPLTTNAPLFVAVACALLLLALFVAVLETEGQTTTTEKVEFGSMTGRVTTATAPGIGIAGVRVSVRRVHAGFADFHFDRITSADGTFEIRYLLPGRYTVEIDRRTVPDAIFPAIPKVLIVDVTRDNSADAELRISRESSVPRTARAVDSVNKKKQP